MRIETRNQTINNIEDKVIAVNTLHKHINKVTPKIIELLKDNLKFLFFYLMYLLFLLRFLLVLWFLFCVC